MGIRQERIANVIRKEVSEMIEFQIKDEMLGFVTVSGVEMSNDYSICKVFVSFLDKDKDDRSQLEILENYAKKFRGQLGKKLMIRKIPVLEFIIDPSFKSGQRIDSILSDLKK